MAKIKDKIINKLLGYNLKEQLNEFKKILENKETEILNLSKDISFLSTSLKDERTEKLEIIKKYFEEAFIISGMKFPYKDDKFEIWNSKISIDASVYVKRGDKELKEEFLHNFFESFKVEVLKRTSLEYCPIEGEYALFCRILIGK
ncbi:MAG: hypothetical protein ACRC0V_04445 [Fusobacteriaceae bacterium]